MQVRKLYIRRGAFPNRRLRRFWTFESSTCLTDASNQIQVRSSIRARLDCEPLEIEGSPCVFSCIHRQPEQRFWTYRRCTQFLPAPRRTLHFLPDLSTTNNLPRDKRSPAPGHLDQVDAIVGK